MQALVEHLEAREGVGESMDIRMEDIRITGTASVTWPEPKPQEQDEQAPPEQVEAANEQEEGD
jgi:hypothetical protein